MDALQDSGLRPLAAPPGMSAGVEQAFRAALAGSGGLVLIAGGAGSGRTTTLEAALASGALSAGKIGDGGSAQSAVQAALGGRLVVAEIEAVSAVDAITRLRLFGVERFMIAAALRIVVAQRLARHLCPACRRPEQAPAALSARLGFDPGAIVYAPVGCTACGATGFRGRIGLFEAIAIDTGLGRLIDGRGDEAVIASHAFRGQPDLGGAARAMVREGVIPAEDALAPAPFEPQSQ
jgi:type II secretory ATPase GspE/PulE/Tfp pilus assembly ATPase PilB-like protein